MIEGTHTGQKWKFVLVHCSSHILELDFLSEKTPFPVNMTASIDSEVAEVKRTQELKVVVLN